MNLTNQKNLKMERIDVTMLTTGIIGIGNAGSQVANLAVNNGIDAVVMNTSENDLATIPDSVIKFPLGDLKGAGKNRDAAKVSLKEGIKMVLSKEEFTKFMTDKDVVFVVSSTGGGTGSGIAPVLTQILKKMFPDTYVIIVGILPKLNEAYSTQVNTVAYMEELYKKLENPTYMFYDNEKLADIPVHLMMERINQSIVDDVKILAGTYNYSTKYSSIDEKDMSMIISTTGRIVVASYRDIKEKDLDKASIDKTLVNNLKNGTHAEIQLDKIIKRFGLIVNLSSSMANNFDIAIPELQEFIGSPIEEFNHTCINEEKSLPNNVFFIGAGLSPITDRVVKINERIEELDAAEKAREADTDMFTVDVSEANEKREYKQKSKDTSVDLLKIFDDFI